MFLAPLPPSFQGSVQPDEITGLQLWLSADSGVYSDAGVTLATDGQTVQQWNDRSASGLNASQATANLRPTYVIRNGRPALEFIGSDTTGKLLSVGANGDFDEQFFTVFVVFENTGVYGGGGAGGDFQVMLTKADGTVGANTTWEILVESSGLASAWAGGPNRPYSCVFATGHSAGTNNDDCFAPDTMQQQILTCKRVSATSKIMYRNGVQVATGSDAGNALNTGAAILGIGRPSGTANVSYKGYIREILYYNSALSADDQRKVETYLRHKWANDAHGYKLNLTVSGPYPANDSQLFESYDEGLTWTVPAGVTNPVISNIVGPGGVGTTTDTQAAPGFCFYKGFWWAIFEINVFEENIIACPLYRATVPAGPWTYIMDVPIFASQGVGENQTWEPRFFFDDDGSLHVLCTAINGANTSDHFGLYITAPLNDAMTSWPAAATRIAGVGTGTGFPDSILDSGMLSRANSPDGLYHLFFKQENNDPVAGEHLIGHATSTSLTSGWTVVDFPEDDFLALGETENSHIVKVGPSLWRFYSTRHAEHRSRCQESTDLVTWTCGGVTEYAGFSDSPNSGVTSCGVWPQGNDQGGA